jgi:DNA-binding NarL/FixJ family response regulator
MKPVASTHPSHLGSLIVLASSSLRTRKRWGEQLEGSFVTCEVADLASVKRNLASLRPSVVLLDLDLAGLGGLRGLRAIARTHPETKVIALAAETDESEAVAVLGAGARGYFEREADSLLVRKAVEMVQKGEIWVRRSVLLHILGRLSKSAARITERASPLQPPQMREALSGRQLEVAQLIADGAANREIATRMRISEKTVKAHLTAIFRKVGVANRLHLALWMRNVSAGTAGRIAGGARGGA